jgi:hypothetical protein
VCRTVNTEPLPGSLVTVTSPPIIRARLREKARPSPVLPWRIRLGAGTAVGLRAFATSMKIERK